MALRVVCEGRHIIVVHLSLIIREKYNTKNM